MEQIAGYEVMDFTYESKTFRNNHIAKMELDGWVEDEQLKKLKDNVSIMDAKESDYQWYARFRRNTL